MTMNQTSGATVQTNVSTSNLVPMSGATNYDLVAKGEAVLWEKEFYLIDDAKNMIWDTLIESSLNQAANSNLKKDKELLRAINYWIQNEEDIPTQIICKHSHRKNAIAAVEDLILQNYRSNKGKLISLKRQVEGNLKNMQREEIPDELSLLKLKYAKELAKPADNYEYFAQDFSRGNA